MSSQISFQFVFFFFRFWTKPKKISVLKQSSIESALLEISQRQNALKKDEWINFIWFESKEGGEERKWKT